MSNHILRQALVLGALSSVGPFAIDMYLPAMPAIGADIDASVPAMQSTITAYFIAFGLAQLVYGPWSDQAGRRVPLYAGLLIFLIGSVVCTFAATSEAVQGMLMLLMRNLAAAAAGEPLVTPVRADSPERTG